MLEAAGRSAGLLDPTDMPERHRAELEEAAKQAADAGVATRLVLAVGTRELGFYQRLLGQSTSQAVAHHARCDVLIAH